MPPATVLCVLRQQKCLDWSRRGECASCLLGLDSRIIREGCGRFPDADQTGLDVGLYLPCHLAQTMHLIGVFCVL